MATQDDTDFKKCNTLIVVPCSQVVEFLLNCPAERSTSDVISPRYLNSSRCDGYTARKKTVLLTQACLGIRPASLSETNYVNFSVFSFSLLSTIVSGR